MCTQTHEHKDNLSICCFSKLEKKSRDPAYTHPFNSAYSDEYVFLKHHDLPSSMEIKGKLKNFKNFQIMCYISHVQKSEVDQSKKHWEQCRNWYVKKRRRYPIKLIWDQFRWMHILPILEILWYEASITQLMEYNYWFPLHQCFLRNITNTFWTHSAFWGLQLKTKEDLSWVTFLGEKYLFAAVFVHESVVEFCWAEIQQKLRLNGVMYIFI